ncbi:copper homeostasis protein CutC [Gilvibacter sp.]|uniref:copper homeostasis protein CutC n=1 Tax=Gilvibacter sp. TaxID=2729997 RepID=UPI003F4A3FC8
MLLEICTPSLESVHAAVKGGADRIELCEQLNLGGVTPSMELLTDVLNQFQIDTQVLIRKRGGNFCFSEEEIQQMIHSIEKVKSLGAHGVVIGALTADGKLDVEALNAMIEAAGNLEITFHKAIDEMTDPDAAIEQLIAMGFTRILTSAGAQTAVEGLGKLKQWQTQFGDRITIMPGGSIRPENISKFSNQGFGAIHSAAIKKGELHSNESLVSQMKAALVG